MISIWGVLLPQIDYHSLVEAKHRGEFGRGAKGYRPVAANTLVMRVAGRAGRGESGGTCQSQRRHGGREDLATKFSKGGAVSREREKTQF